MTRPPSHLDSVLQQLSPHSTPAQMRRVYEKGASIMQIAAATQRPFRPTRRILVQAGARIRPRGWAKPRTPQASALLAALTPHSSDEQMRMAFEAGVRISEIAAATQMSTSAVYDRVAPALNMSSPLVQSLSPHSTDREVCHAYTQGASGPQIAAATRRSEGAVYQLLERNGIPRQRRFQTRQPWTAPPQDNDE